MERKIREGVDAAAIGKSDVELIQRIVDDIIDSDTELVFVEDGLKAAVKKMAVMKNEKFIKFLTSLKLTSTTQHLFEMIDKKIEELKANNNH